MNLEESLQECTLALLRRIAASHSIARGDDTLRSELAALISQRLADPEYLALFTADLPEDEKQVVNYLSAREWTGKAFLLERQFPRREGDGSTGASLCLSLLQKGILYRSFGMIDSWRGELYHIPEELRPALSGLGVPGVDRPLMEAMSVPDPTRIDEQDGPLGLFTLLSYLLRAERRSFQGLLSRNDLPRLEQECPYGGFGMRADDAEKRWSFLLRLCLGAGWVWRDGQFLRPGRGATQALAGSRPEVRRRLLDRYTRDRAWSDLEGAGRVRQPVGSRRIDECAARQIVLHYLKEWAHSGWVSEDAFRSSLRSTNPDFLREDFASLASAVVDIPSETELAGDDSWDSVEGEWLHFVLHGPLFWMGIIVWGLDSAGNRSALRLRDGLEEPTVSPGLPAAAPAVAFSEDLSVIAPSGVDLAALYRLEPYMVFRRLEPSGRAYRFTGPSVHRGMERGGSWEELRGLVWQSSGGLVSAGSLNQLEELARAYGRVVLEGAVLLTAASEEDLEDVARMPGISALLGERIGPRSYRVPDQRFWQLITNLKEGGVEPRLDPSVGTMRARHATGDPALLREALFALLLVRALHGPLDLEAGASAQRALEAALGTEVTDEISRRVQETVRKLRGRAESGW